MKKYIIPILVSFLLTGCQIPGSKSESNSSSSNYTPSSSSGNSKTSSDEYDSQGRLILNLKNVYFSDWDGSDEFTELLNQRFGVNIKPSSYDYSNWNEQVIVSVSGDNLPDVFQFNLNSFNFGSTYEKWAKQQIIKPLPETLSNWPNLEKLIERTSNIHALKYDGKLYCLPTAIDSNNYSREFSDYTYIYRRDIAKAIDEENSGVPGYIPIYKEGDVYTWEEFNRLLNGFSAYADRFDYRYTLVDENWTFPSIANFYKDAPYCFSRDSSGRVINAFTTDKYINGLNVAKQFVSDSYYSVDQYAFQDNRARDFYRASQAFVLYDDMSYNNYLSLRKSFKYIYSGATLDDVTAFLKVKDPDGKFALEGRENWFSAIMFDYNVSNTKMNKILDILDFLLSEEGTRLAVYGKEGRDFHIEDGKVVLNEEAWEKDADGKYVPKTNGANYLRYMVSLEDTRPIDPYTDLETFNIYNDWQIEMRQAYVNGQLRVIKESSDVAWLSTPTKNDRTMALLDDARVCVLKYVFNRISYEEYLNQFNTSTWTQVLNEINNKLGY